MPSTSYPTTKRGAGLASLAPSTAAEIWRTAVPHAVRIAGVVVPVAVAVPVVAAHGAVGVVAAQGIDLGCLVFLCLKSEEKKKNKLKRKYTSKIQKKKRR